MSYFSEVFPDWDERYASLNRVFEETRAPPRRTKFLRDKGGSGVPRFLQVHFINKRMAHCVSRDVLKHIDCDEVYDGIFVGNGTSFMHHNFLHHVGITAIVNCAEGRSCSEYVPETDPEDMKRKKISYLGFKVHAIAPTRLMLYLDIASNFIRSAIKEGGKVLIYSALGYTRAPAIVVAYLIKKERMSAEEAVRQVKSLRYFDPQFDTLKQLLWYDLEFRKHEKWRAEKKYLQEQRNFQLRVLERARRITFLC